MNEQMNQSTFGVEIEMTNITREQAARIACAYLNGTINHECDGYDTYAVIAADGRKWKFMYDGSIRKTRCGERVDDRNYSVEMVTPVLTYNEDIETLQEIIRLIRHAGAKTNDSCGIHVHIGGDRHNEKTIKNYINYMSGREKLFYKALDVLETRQYYCQTMTSEFVEKINGRRQITLNQIQDDWYETYAPLENRTRHYNRSRYHFLNLHSYFNMEHHTIEIRGFNSTLHAGKIRAYIVLCLAINDFCLNANRVSAKQVQMENVKFSMRIELKRLGLVGDEFKNVRKHLMANLEGNTAHRFGAIA